ncbi:hypothetical protein N7523_009866 [Penicillium sp. IBT 18751x]|nr:hypothetical protein N7523_009866 [Penicillium sp. IBT 18751x]
MRSTEIAMSKFTTAPPQPEVSLLSFPAPHVILVTLNRAREMNCINAQGHADLDAVWQWMDEEPSLRVGILTGKGQAFCAGGDLKEWNTRPRGTKFGVPMPPSGFGGLTRRKGKKPVICAVNGYCLGGGAEIIINSDIVIAASRAIIGLPEVKRGVVALAGSLPRLVRTVGKQRATEMVLTGRPLSAAEAEKWGLVNEVVDVDEKATDEMISAAVVSRALALAEEIAGYSPDAALISREGVKLGWEGIGADEATGLFSDTWVKRLYEGENIKEGLRAFAEKRMPVWVDSKL